MIPGEDTATAHGQETDWETLIKTCQAWRVKPDVIVWPEDHMEQAEVAARGVIIRELRRLGWKPLRIASLCPVSERTLWRAFKRKNLNQPALRT